MAQKYSLLQIVQLILSDMDSEEVNSIADTNEAQQIASVVRDVFYNLTATSVIPEHRELFRLTASSDVAYPTHFQIPEKVKEVTNLWYEDEDGQYTEVHFMEPLEFLRITDTYSDNYVVTFDKDNATKLRVKTDENPKFYTTFDDEWIVLNAYDSDASSTLLSSKLRAFGYVSPSFSLTDSFVPDIDANMFPLLIAEAKSTALSLFKGGSDAKVEQHARRLQTKLQNDKHKIKTKKALSTYGR